MNISIPKKNYYCLYFLSPSNDNIEKYTNSLYNTYSKKNNGLEILLGQIRLMNNIPIEIISKYYARVITSASSFHSDINLDLGLNKIDKHLPFIKTLYEWVKLQSLPLANNNILYRGTKISNDEIIKIEKYLKNKIKDLPASIVFCRAFLSFSKEKSVADYFLSFKNDNKNLSKVLFIIEKDDKLDYNLSTHGDIEKISFFQTEKEVLFFPFSSFEIKNINETTFGNEKGYEIKLFYLGKYLKDIEEDKNIIINDIKIPDSEFKTQLAEFGLIQKEKIVNLNSKILYNSYKKYENYIKEKEKAKKKLRKKIVSILDEEPHIGNPFLLKEKKIEPGQSENESDKKNITDEKDFFEEKGEIQNFDKKEINKIKKKYPKKK